MRTFLFDVNGTLVGNSALSDEDARKLLLTLISKGHNIILMSGDVYGIPEQLSHLAHACWEKPVSSEKLESFMGNLTIVDDDVSLLRAYADSGHSIIAAEQLGLVAECLDWS